MRYFLSIAYNGKNYHGWQLQQNAHTVQAEVNRALSIFLKKEINCVGSGRTDTGVHALQQVIHFDGPEIADLSQLRFKLNALLPHDIAVDWVRQVDNEAHARFDAVRRSYIYKTHRCKTPFVDGLSYFFPRKLDVSAMNSVAALLLGKQNFQSFSRVKTEVNTFICTVKEAKWEEENDQLNFHVSADRFLRGMVRALVGTLLLVGEKSITHSQFQEIIASCHRTKAGRAVPPHGLYLSEVRYPENIFTN